MKNDWFATVLESGVLAQTAELSTGEFDERANSLRPIHLGYQIAHEGLSYISRPVYLNNTDRAQFSLSSFKFLFRSPYTLVHSPQIAGQPGDQIRVALGAENENVSVPSGLNQKLVCTFIPFAPER